MICRRDKLHEVFLNHVRILACQRGFHIRVDDTLLRHEILQIVVDKLGVVLGADTGQIFMLGLRDAQLVERGFDLLRDLVPGALHFRVRADIGDDLVHVKAVDRRAPRRHLHPVVEVKGLQAELMHPLRIMLFLRDLIDDLGRQSLLDLVEILFVVLEVIETPVRALEIGIDIIL